MVFQFHSGSRFIRLEAMSIRNGPISMKLELACCSVDFTSSMKGLLLYDYARLERRLGFLRGQLEVH